MAILPKVINIFTEIPIKFQWPSIVEVEKLIIKFIWNFKEPPSAKTIFKEKNKVGGSTLPYFRTTSKL